MSNHKEPYGFVKNLRLIEAAFYDDRIKPKALGVLALLIRFADQDGVIKWFSVNSSSGKKGNNRKSIQRPIGQLEQHRYIKKEVGTGIGGRNIYYLLFDNLKMIEGATQLCHIPPATLLGRTPVTQLGHKDATSEGHTKKTIENIEIKKEKRAHTLDDFLLLVEEGFENGLFGDLRTLGLDEIKKQAIACWDRWEATAAFPEGNMVSALKGWIRNGIQKGVIKIKPPSNEQSANNVLKTNLEGLAEWKIALHSKLGEAIFNAWIKNLELDEHGDLIAPNAHAANWVMDKYMKEIIAVLPNVSNIYAAKDAAAVN